ncbi:MAG: hypothetical protein ABH817_02115 [archaeon]
MQKRGQVTIFIIIAIAIVIIGLTLFIFREQIFGFGQESKDIKEIRVYIEDCLEVTLEEALVFIGMQGGFAEPTSYIETEIGPIVYWKHYGRDLTPSLEDIGKNISQYINYVLPLCTNGFTFFRQQGYEFTEEEVITQTSINSKGISVKVTYPISIVKEDSSFKIKDFSVSVNVRLVDIYNSAKRVLALHGETLDFTGIIEEEFDFSILQYSNADYIYVITDNSSIILNSPYTFMFAAR